MPILLNALELEKPETDQVIRCAPHPGFVLVGLRIHSAGYVAAVQPIFAELLDGGAHGSELLEVPGVASPIGRAAAVTPMLRGAVRELRVASGRVVTGIQIRSRRYIEAIHLEETPWNGSLRVEEARWTSWLGRAKKNGPELAQGITEQKLRAIAVGIAVRSGLFIKDLGFVTAQAHRVSAEPAHRHTVATAVR